MSDSDNIRAHIVRVAAGEQSSACVIEIVGGNRQNNNRLLYTWGNNMYGKIFLNNKITIIIITIITIMIITIITIIITIILIRWIGTWRY